MLRNSVRQKMFQFSGSVFSNSWVIKNQTNRYLCIQSSGESRCELSSV